MVVGEATGVSQSVVVDVVKERKKRDQRMGGGHLFMGARKGASAFQLTLSRCFFVPVKAHRHRGHVTAPAKQVAMIARF